MDVFARPLVIGQRSITEEIIGDFKDRLFQLQLRQEFFRDILQFLKDNRALYEAEAEDLYDRHFAAMYERA